MRSLEPLGDRAFLARFDREEEAQAWARTIRSGCWTGVTDVVLAYRSAAVHVDPDQVDLNQLERELRFLNSQNQANDQVRLHTIPVRYDGVDLHEAASRLNLSPAEVIAIHSGAEYHVFAIGFLPGFPYAGYLPAQLSGLRRLAKPRLSVPEGSVAIVGTQTAIYPRQSPGGWHLLGRTPLRIADVERGRFPIRAGDKLRFEPIDQETFETMYGGLL